MTETARTCPVCGEMIVGRCDKKFCSDDCRIYFNNIRYREKYRIRAQNRELTAICSNAVFLCEKKSFFLLKILGFLSQVCKIISTFDFFKSRLEKHI